MRSEQRKRMGSEVVYLGKNFAGEDLRLRLLKTPASGFTDTDSYRRRLEKKSLWIPSFALGNFLSILRGVSFFCGMYGTMDALGVLLHYLSHGLKSISAPGNGSAGALIGYQGFSRPSREKLDLHRKIRETLEGVFY